MSETIVIFAGKADDYKWDNYLGTPKHLVTVPSADDRSLTVPLLLRTLRQVLALKPEASVYVTIPPGERGRRYQDALAPVLQSVYDVTVIEEHNQCDSGSPYVTPWSLHTNLWQFEGRTTLMLGDVFYTDASISRILTCELPLFHAARYGPSYVTGCTWGEDYAFGFDHTQSGVLLNAMRQVVDWFQAGMIPRGSSWEIWQHLNGVDPSEMTVPPDFDLRHYRLDIADDGTDDIDYAVDYRRLQRTW